MAAKAGEVLEMFKRRYPKQHKRSGMLYSGKYSGRAIGRIKVHTLLISDEGNLAFKHIIINHPIKQKTPIQWSNWLDQYGSRIMTAVADSMHRENSQLWKVRTNLGWSDDTRRSRAKVSKRKRHNKKKARR